MEGSKVTTRNKSKDTAECTTASLQSIDAKLNSILGILEQNSNDICDIKKEQKDMCASIEMCHANIGDIKHLITNQDKKIAGCEEEISRLREEKVKMNRQIKKMEEELRDIEQYSHRNSLIIYGIPEEKGENIQSVMRRLAIALQFPDWSSSLIDAVHRMGKSVDSKPRPIIVKFVSRLDKDVFWNKRKVRRNLKAADLGFSSENLIFINESLTSGNRELLRMTQEKARAKGYSHVWTANCSIYVRRGNGSPAIRISSSSDWDRM